VANLRRGRVGRRLLAVRTNERAAAALGISVVEAKFYAFALSAAIAGLGGILLGFQNETINWDGFDPFTSILMVAYAVIGGVGFVLGPIYGSLLVVGGIASYITSLIVPGLTNWLALIGGLTLIQILLISPNGLAEEQIRRLTRLRARLYRDRREPRPERVTAAAVKPVKPAHLKVSGLVVRFGGVAAVNGVSLEVRPGRIAGLIGPNGAGKSTLINAVTGFVKPAGGHVLLDGRPIDGWPVVRRARAGIARSFQSLELFEDVSVLENLRAASDLRDRLAYLTNLFAPRNQRLGPEVIAAIREFGLAEELYRRPTEISYGKRRLVAVARAVAAAPSILLLDEPAAGLSESETRELGVLLRRLAAERGLGILLVEHDLAFVLDICDELTVLDFGRQIASGPPAAVRADPAVIAAYIGEPEDQQPSVTVARPEGG
jgi:ABC-type branched-subunit amino acid transport system ATPase component